MVYVRERHILMKDDVCVLPGWNTYETNLIILIFGMPLAKIMLSPLRINNLAEVDLRRISRVLV